MTQLWLENLDNPDDPWQVAVFAACGEVIEVGVPSAQVRFKLYRAHGRDCFFGTFGGRRFGLCLCSWAPAAICG